jgi:hypothetical protein
MMVRKRGVRSGEDGVGVEKWRKRATIAINACFQEARGKGWRLVFGLMYSIKSNQ